MGKTGTALITGGGGFVGARLAGRLVNDGYAEVRCVDIGFGPGGLAAAEPQHPKIKRIVSERIDQDACSLSLLSMLSFSFLLFIIVEALAS